MSNNLTRAFYHADSINKPQIEDILKWLYNKAPSSCWGSPEKVADWMENRQIQSRNHSLADCSMADTHVDIVS